MNDFLLEEYFRLRAQKPTGNSGYYQVSFFVDDDGNFENSLQTSWCGFTETLPRREIRKGRLFNPEPRKKWLDNRMKQPCIIVNSAADLLIFFLWGGHALIEKELADLRLEELVSPRDSMRHSSHLGFIGVDALPKSKVQYAPSKKLRMEVIQRDQFRCIVCGRSPAEYVDVELHVHHIIPWGIGSITERENLITICKTCHDGLDPHYTPTLSTIQKEKKHFPVVPSNEYFNRIENYQLAIYNVIQESKLEAKLKNQADA